MPLVRWRRFSNLCRLRMAFTGVFFGMYATGNDKQSNVPAAFDCFEYKTAD
nr:hypothetical protein [Paenibacillus sp. Soil766]